MPRKSIPSSASASKRTQSAPRAVTATAALIDASVAATFRRRLLAWFTAHGRDLPWRRTRDAYHVVVSEFMLQQTQVSRVEGYYARFLSRFPDVHALAAAPATEVREAWAGLGYYRRAANLQRLAQTVAAEHAGRLPADVVQLQALPGVGRYTAGAVASFAYEQSVPAVDTNVARVLRRAFRPDRPANPNDRVLWEVGGALVPERATDAWSFNQAIMELGAVRCTARVANCGGCPVRPACLLGQLTHADTLRGAELDDAMQAAAELVAPSLTTD